MSDKAEAIATLAKTAGLGDVEVHHSPDTDIWAIRLPTGEEWVGAPPDSYSHLRQQILAHRALRRRVGVPRTLAGLL